MVYLISYILTLIDVILDVSKLKDKINFSKKLLVLDNYFPEIRLSIGNYFNCKIEAG